MPMRNMPAEKNAVDKFIQSKGRKPETPEDWSAVHTVAYPSINELPEEMRNATTEAYYANAGATPVEPTMEGLARNVDVAEKNLDNMSKPNSALRVLQDAIRKRTNSGNQKLGQSETFEKAGLTGMANLGQSLAARQSEIKNNFANFQNIISEMSGTYSEMANVALRKYEVAQANYNKQVDKINNEDAEMRRQEYAIELAKMQSDFRKEEIALRDTTPSVSEQLAADEAGFDISDEGRLVPQSRVTPTGIFKTTTLNGRNIEVDSVAQPSLIAINDAAAAAGFDGLVIGSVEHSSHRTTEVQQELYDRYVSGEGGLAAKPGTSAHERGMAIDLYPDHDYIAKMKPIMEANGWIQNAGANDLGHFEYVGTEQEANVYDDNIEFSYNEKIDTTKLPDLGGKAITDKSARMSNLPFGITAEQSNWIMERRPGNIEFQRLKSVDYDALAGLLELRKDLVEIKDLKTRTKTGPIDATRQVIGAKTGIGDTEDFSLLRIKTGKNLADYIKSLSGAAVSNAEALRLKVNVPNVGQQDGEFDEAIKDYESDLDTLIRAKLTQFGIESEEELSDAVLGASIHATQLIGDDNLRNKYNY